MWAYQVDTRLSGNLDVVDYSNGMIELLARLLEAAFDWASAGGYLSMRGRDELHLLRHEQEEVVSSLMLDLATCKRHVARVGQARRDLAWVHSLAALHNRRAADPGRLIPESRRAPLLCRPEVILSLASGKMISARSSGRGKVEKIDRA